MMDAEGGLSSVLDNMGTKLATFIRRGVAGWHWLLRDSSGEREVKYSESALSFIPYDVRLDIANKVYEISTLGEELADELRNTVRAAFLRSKAKSEKTWDCETCMSKRRLQAARRCPFEEDDSAKPVVDPRDVKYMQRWDVKNLQKGKLSPWLTYGGHQFESCPIGSATPRGNRLLRLIVDCERNHCLPANPPVLLEQPYLFCESRSIVDQERHDLAKLAKEGQKVKPQNVDPIKEVKDQYEVRRAYQEQAAQGIASRSAGKAPKGPHVPLGSGG